MKQQGYQIFIALFALIGMCSACSEPYNEESIPEFHLELVDELFLKTAYGNNYAVEIAICVKDGDVKYLKQPYILSIDKVYGGDAKGDIRLTNGVYDEETGEYQVLDEICSIGDLESIKEFNDDMMDRGYKAYASFLVVNKEVMSAFRLKLDFYETGEVFYTTDYTLKRTSIGNESSYRIMPGTWYY